MIAIQRSDARDAGSFDVQSSEDGVAAMRTQFEQEHHVVLRGLIRGDLLDAVMHEVNAAEFEEFEHTGGVKTEKCMKSPKAMALLDFIANDPRLFELVREVSGCGRIGCYTGRVYWMDPSPKHQDHWHDDLCRDRMVTMSVNLSPEPYEGGLLQLREKESKQVLAEVHNVGLGDALVFRIARGLEHRVTTVTGSHPKVAYAGWFRAGPEWLSWS